eukprot:6214266-Pleurochrysis_carterae.AAC.5
MSLPLPLLITLIAIHTALYYDNNVCNSIWEIPRFSAHFPKSRGNLDSETTCLSLMTDESSKVDVRTTSMRLERLSAVRPTSIILVHYRNNSAPQAKRARAARDSVARFPGHRDKIWAAD